MTQLLLENLRQTKLPIVEKIDEIRAALRLKNNLVLQADPGAGKTTIVPLSLLDLVPCKLKILLLEPRRLAAKNAAARMAQLNKDKLGQTIGFRIRNEQRISPETRIEVITEGILIRMLQADPELITTGLIIFDEFHERSLDADLGLAFAIEAQQNLRADLKLLVMSATIDTQSISKLMGNAPIIECWGRCFPVTVEYSPPKLKRDWLVNLINVIRRVIMTADDLSKIDTRKSRTGNDILVFLPGVGEIKTALLQIEKLLIGQSKIALMALYGELPFDKQQQALLPIKDKRKIILATNIAETSVTIEGVNCVIDSGLVRQSSFDARAYLACQNNRQSDTKQPTVR
jgi:ATP-dependent RNA helicase HrpB